MPLCRFQRDPMHPKIDHQRFGPGELRETLLAGDDFGKGFGRRQASDDDVASSRHVGDRRGDFAASFRKYRR